MFLNTIDSRVSHCGARSPPLNNATGLLTAGVGVPSVRHLDLRDLNFPDGRHDATADMVGQVVIYSLVRNQ
jgi:hypothetical protein